MTYEEMVELRTHYRTVFDTPSGRVVLHDMLMRGNFFSGNLSKVDPGELGRHEHVMETLHILGSFSDNPTGVSRAITETIANVLVRQPIAVSDDE